MTMLLCWTSVGYEREECLHMTDGRAYTDVIMLLTYVSYFRLLTIINITKKYGEVTTAIQAVSSHHGQHRSKKHR